MADSIEDIISRRNKAGLAFDSSHNLTKVKSRDSSVTVLEQFPVSKDVVYGSDFNREREAEAFVSVPDQYSSGLGKVNFNNFGEEHFPDARRFKKNGEFSDWTIWEICRTCKHWHYGHCVCSVGGEHAAFAYDCGEGVCPS